MEKLIKEAVNQLETLLGSELIKLNSLENQLMLIDQMILKLEKYRDRITYRGKHRCIFGRQLIIIMYKV